MGVYDGVSMRLAHGVQIDPFKSTINLNPNDTV